MKLRLLAVAAGLAVWLVTLAGIAGAGPRVSAPLPGDSLFQLPIDLETDEQQVIKLSSLRGQPLLITLFYAQCTSVCPLITSRIQAFVDSLSIQEQHGLTVVMVSLDSEHDTPGTMRAFKKQHEIGRAHV